MKKKLFLLCFFPSLGFASLGEEINNLLDQVFGDDVPPITDQPKSEPETEKQKTEQKNSSWPDIKTLPPESRDIAEKIKKEESSLEDFENKIFNLERQLWEDREKKSSMRSDLQLLDSEMGFTSEKINFLVQQEKKWKADLEKITRQKSNIKAEIRVLTREYIDFMSKKIVRDETFGSGENISMLQWLFSDKTASQIIEENRQVRWHKTIQEQRLKKLKKMQNNMDEKERQAAILYGKISNIKNRLLAEKQNLKDFSEAKARIIAQLEATEEEKSRALRNFKNQKTKLENELEDLRNTLKETQKLHASVLQENDEIILEFPLKVKPKITSAFHDPEYKQEFGIQHTGTDFFAPQGSEIYAPADGIVKKTAFNDYDYSFFVIQHGEDFFTVYGHVSEIFVEENQEVKQGDLVGKTGGTPGTPGAGHFTAGPHLHLEVYKDGEFQDPMLFIRETPSSDEKENQNKEDKEASAEEKKQESEKTPDSDKTEIIDIKEVGQH